MPKCSAITKSGDPCLNNAKPDQTLCGIHINHPPVQAVVAAPRLKRCLQRKADGERCTNTCEGLNDYCNRHEAVRARRRREQAFQRIHWDTHNAIWVANRPDYAQEQLMIRLADLDATPDEIARETAWLQDELEFYEVIHPTRNRARPPPKSELDAFARDRQNVHTKITTRHTNKTLDMLLAIPIEEDLMPPLSRITWAFCDLSRTPSDIKTFRTVLDDMTSWYGKATCREKNDWLYKRTLDGLWMYMKDSPMKDELLKRLWEEAYDSLNMCCEGHISRLCNVLVGFDDAAKPEVSPGELLQQRIAAIAGKDIPVEHKVIDAWAVFEELQIPHDQRMEWIEAF